MAQAGDDPAYSDQHKQADKLLRRIERRSKARPTVQTPGLAAAGGGLLGSAGALGGLSGWQWSVAQAKQAEFEAGTRQWGETVELVSEGGSALTAQRVLAGSAVAAGAGGVVSFILSTVAPAGARAGGKPRPAALVMPTERGGWTLTLAGRF